MIEVIDEMMKGICEGNDRYHMVDHQHIHDTKTDLKYHLYDMDGEPMYVSHKDAMIAQARDFTPHEMTKFAELKKKLEELVTAKARAEFMRLYSSP